MISSKLAESYFLSAEHVELYPLNPHGLPEEVAYGAVYLLSDAASWVTDHSLVIDGGSGI